MNQNKMLVLLFISTCLFVSRANAQNKNSATYDMNLLENMFDSVYSLKYVQFEMFSKERVNGQLQLAHAKGILQYEPRKLFIRGFDEDGELLNEILYIDGENNNNALIASNGFPYINLNLDPKGLVMRRNRHYTILEAGGRYLVDMLRLGLVKYQAIGNMEERFQIVKETETTIEVAIINADYGFTSYKVEANENCRSVANKLGIPEYKIIEINEEVDNFEDLEKGQELKVPTLFAKRVELILRKHDLIPIEVRIFDDQGLYSEYVYSQFNTSPIITNQTFNSKNPAYTF